MKTILKNLSPQSQFSIVAGLIFLFVLSSCGESSDFITEEQKLPDGTTINENSDNHDDDGQVDQYDEKVDKKDSEESDNLDGNEPDDQGKEEPTDNDGEDRDEPDRVEADDQDVEEPDDDEIIEIANFPYSDTKNTEDSTRREFDPTSGVCKPSAGSEAGAEYVYRFTVDSTAIVTADIVNEKSGDEIDVDIHLLKDGTDEEHCIDRDNKKIVKTVEPGTYYLILDTYVTESGTENAGSYDLKVTISELDSEIDVEALERVRKYFENSMGSRYMEKNCEDATYPNWEGFPLIKCRYTVSDGKWATVIMLNAEPAQLARWVVRTVMIVKGSADKQYTDKLSKHIIDASGAQFPVAGVVYENMYGNGYQTYPFRDGVTVRIKGLDYATTDQPTEEEMEKYINGEVEYVFSYARIQSTTREEYVDNGGDPNVLDDRML